MKFLRLTFIVNPLPAAGLSEEEWAGRLRQESFRPPGFATS